MMKRLQQESIGRERLDVINEQVASPEGDQALPYVGETEKNVGKLFEGAESQEPLVFDKADALPGKRAEVENTLQPSSVVEIAPDEPSPEHSMEEIFTVAGEPPTPADGIGLPGDDIPETISLDDDDDGLDGI